MQILLQFFCFKNVYFGEQYTFQNVKMFVFTNDVRSISSNGAKEYLFYKVYVHAVEVFFAHPLLSSPFHPTPDWLLQLPFEQSNG